LVRDHGNDKWTIDELQYTMLKEIQILEIGIENPINNQAKLPTPTASFHTNTDKKPPHNHTKNQKKLACVFC